MIDKAEKGHPVPYNREQSSKMERVTEEEKKIMVVPRH